MLKTWKEITAGGVKLATLATLLTGVLATSTAAQTREVHRHNGKFFQNVAAEHVMPLLGGRAVIGHVDYEGIGLQPSGGEVSITWTTRRGKEITCFGLPSKGGVYGVGETPIKGVVIENRRMSVRYPLLEGTVTDFVDGEKVTDVSYKLLRYDSSTGGLTSFWFYKHKWWEAGTGHLQERLPAVVYELCPDFPSAKSLGARINHKQTAKFYHDLVRQDPGRRVLKPEYEAKTPPVVWLDRHGNPREGQ
jgi:hypothetical protein